MKAVRRRNEGRVRQAALQQRAMVRKDRNARIEFGKRPAFRLARVAERRQRHALDVSAADADGVRGADSANADDTRSDRFHVLAWLRCAGSLSGGR